MGLSLNSVRSVRSVRPQQAWRLQAASDLKDPGGRHAEVRRRFVLDGGFWAAPPDGLQAVGE